MSGVLTVQHLSKRYGAFQAVTDVSFDISAGEFVALIGPNGAGKSTCFNMLNGQLPPTQGKIFLHGEDITGLPPNKVWQRGVGRTFQIAATYRSMNARENVQMALMSHHRQLNQWWGRARNQHVARADELLDLVGMGHQADRPCGILAYGDLKSLELAMALANEPRVLLMDEPAAGMAGAERQRIMQLTADIVREQGISVLFTEHDMDVVFAHANRILVLAQGELIATGTPNAVRADAKVQEIYLGTGATYGSEEGAAHAER